LTHRLYRSEAARLLSNLPHTIKNLEINGDMFDCVPEALEQGPPRLTDLIIQQRVDSLPVFTNASQLGCFKKLTLLKNLEMHLSPSIQIYNEGFASLSTVCLKTFIVQKSDYSDINLGWILAAFPLLEQLEIYAFKNAFFIKEEKSQPIYLKLKKLSISTSMIDPRFLNLLGILAPNINELSLHISDEDILNISKQQKLSMAIRTMFSKIDYVWDLTAFDLHVFHLFFTKQANQDLFQTTSVYFTIQIGQESKSLVYHHGRGSVPIDTYSKKKIAELPKVTLLCNKVRKIIFNDCTEIVSIESGITIVEKPFLYNNIVFCSLEL
jgi:hypothetical protein